MNQDIPLALSIAYEQILQTYVIASGQRNNTKSTTVLPISSIIEDQTAKARPLGIKCMSLLDINFYGFSNSAKLYQQQI